MQEARTTTPPQKLPRPGGGEKACEIGSRRANAYRLYGGAVSAVHGFSLSGQRQTNWPQPGQPRPYLFAIASERSTPATLAIVASQANTSANSSNRSWCEPLRSAVASSPTSSISHKNVPSTPRAWSFSKYIFRISACKSASDTFGLSLVIVEDGGDVVTAYALSLEFNRPALAARRKLILTQTSMRQHDRSRRSLRICFRRQSCRHP